MAWLLVFFIVFVALAPLLSMRPSRRQLELARLREQAAVAGMLVQLQAPPDSPDKTLVPVYSRRRAREQQPERPSAVYRRTAQGWLGSNGRIDKAVVDLLTAMPAGVSHVSENQVGVAAYWDERGGSEDLERIDSLLRSLLPPGAASETSSGNDFS